MPKWIKFLIGIVLLPVCWAAGRALIGLSGAALGEAELVWVPFLAGAACWLAVFLLLPRPAWLYVVGHELTHVLWAWVFGGRVRAFHASSKGGYVVLTRSNFVVALAPYFFPLYAAAVVVVFAAGNLFWDWSAHAAWFHLLLGAAWSFHVTLTCAALRISQTDITGQGLLFSGTIIWLGNAVVLLAGMALLTGTASVQDAARLFWREMVDLTLVIRRIP